MPPLHRFFPSLHLPIPLPSLSSFFYSTSFTLLLTLLTVLLIITPADLIHQALTGRAGKQPYNIFIIIGCYALALVFSIGIYVSRLYQGRRMMEDIPKNYVPIRKGDLPGRVYRRVREGLGKGAVLAWQSRPKGRVVEREQQQQQQHQHQQQQGAGTGADGVRGGVGGGGKAAGAGGQDGGGGGTGQRQRQQQQQPTPFWGEINHPGWSPPDSPDLPNVEYSAIIAELPYLIEKKATYLASQSHHGHSQMGHHLQSHSHPPLHTHPTPPFPTYPTDYHHTHNIASRKPYMSLAAYISYLTSLGYVDEKVGNMFVKEYEKCRFWQQEMDGIQEREFRWLMKVFAGLLRGMEGVPWEIDEGEFFGEDRGGFEGVGQGHCQDGEVGLGMGIGMTNNEGSVWVNPAVVNRNSGRREGSMGLEMGGMELDMGMGLSVGDDLGYAYRDGDEYTSGTGGASSHPGTMGSIIVRPPGVNEYGYPSRPEDEEEESLDEEVGYAYQLQLRPNLHQQSRFLYHNPPTQDTEFNTKAEEYDHDDGMLQYRYGGRRSIESETSMNSAGGSGSRRGPGMGSGVHNHLTKIFTRSSTGTTGGDSPYDSGSVRRRKRSVGNGEVGEEVEMGRLSGNGSGGYG